MFGAWEAGVWKALERRFQPGLIVGASVGALNGWAIAGGCTAEELMEAWLDPATGAILRFGLHRAGVLRPEALHAKARELFARYRPRIPFGLTVVEVPRLRLRLVRDSEITWQHLAAAGSIPFCLPPVCIGGMHYVDGGLLGALPLWAAAEMGATRAIAVNALTTLPFRALHRILRPLVPRAQLEVALIEPSAPLGSLRDAVAWSRANVERWIEQGERDGNRACTSITM